jgi:hypothetical protein
MGVFKLSMSLTAFGYGVLGVIDYNRQIKLADPNYPKTEISHLGEALEYYHGATNDHWGRQLTFYTILSNRTYCDECWYIYENALRSKEGMIKDGLGHRDAEDAVVSAYRSLIRRMTRRALIRNGHYLKWICAVTYDGFPGTVPLLPAVAILISVALIG